MNRDDHGERFTKPHGGQRSAFRGSGGYGVVVRRQPRQPAGEMLVRNSPTDIQVEDKL